VDFHHLADGHARHILNLRSIELGKTF